MGRFTYYAVYKGFDRETKTEINKKIYDTWDEAKKYVVSIEHARYKGFSDKEQAEHWFDKLDNIPVAKDAIAVPRPEPEKSAKIKSIEKIMDPYEGIADNLRNEFDSICKNLGIDPKCMLESIIAGFIMGTRNINIGELEDDE